MSRMSINQATAAAIDRRNARAEADAWFNEQLAAGYTVPGLAFRLGLRQEDVTLLTGAFVLAKEAATLGMAVPPIIDADGRPHQLTLAELTATMLGYGQHRAELSAQYAARVAAAEAQ